MNTDPHTETAEDILVEGKASEFERAHNLNPYSNIRILYLFSQLLLFTTQRVNYDDSFEAQPPTSLFHSTYWTLNSNQKPLDLFFISNAVVNSTDSLNTWNLKESLKVSDAFAVGCYECTYLLPSGSTMKKIGIFL